MFRKSIAIPVAASVLALAASMSAAAATSWDLATDYLTNTNPNGEWQYGQIPGGVFSQLAWNAGTNSYGIGAAGQTFIYQNTGVFDYGIGPGKVSLESDWGNAAVRWTAPVAGSYTFNIAIGGTTDPGPGGYGNNFAQFGGVRVNGANQFGEAFIANLKFWNFTVNLASGDTVDAFVLNPGFANGGNTQTEFAVTAVPEPTSALMLGLGLGVVAFLQKRGKAQVAKA